MGLMEDLGQLQERAAQELTTVQDTAGLEAWRVKYLSRKGELSSLMSMIGRAPAETRAEAGKVANAVKSTLEMLFGERQSELEGAAERARLEADSVDITMPGRAAGVGQLHPTTLVLREILDTFNSMGFETVEGPEVEWDKYNFDMLNIPDEHPARDMWDTFYVQAPPQAISEGGLLHKMLLRTHTSPNQARVMERQEPPVRVVVPGLCYRYEATDATHEAMFYQVEGLAVDKGIKMSDLRGVLLAFAQRLFGSERKVRFRCDYFPFVEPGVDVSISCHLCNGKGCAVCKQSGWIEIMGAGMVHPNVLQGVGYDPAVYTGFAFGMGPERIALLKYGINDIRLLYDRDRGNDLRFLRQFK